MSELHTANQDNEVEDADDCYVDADLAELDSLQIEENFTQVELLSDEQLEDFSVAPEAVTASLESFLRPGGGWGGSVAPVQRAIGIGNQNGLTVTSLKRTSGSTGSDHHTSQRLAYAADMSNSTGPTPAMLRTARQIAAAMGYAWPANGYLQTATTSLGYRAQLIYNSPVVPGHHNHVHFGVKKVR
jgi:hypothetical protein